MTTSAGNCVRCSDRYFGYCCMGVVALLFLICCTSNSVSRKRQGEIVSFSGPTMGTQYTVRYVSQENNPEPEHLQSLAEKRLQKINRQMSTYDPDSELSRFNRHTGDDWFPVSAETAEVVAFALDVAVKSDGAFDPTIGPVVNLWGFGPVRRRELPPAEADIAEAMTVVGFDKLEVRREPPALRKSVPGLYVDLSAIAKGFAVDEISALLSRVGCRASMVEIGGEVRTRGLKADDSPWRIGIEKPDSEGRSIQTVIELRDSALASSGDYRNFFQRDGVRYSHTIDPQTGRPVSHHLATVSVRTESCMKADALATALLVMGEAKGYDWCTENDVAALFLIRQDKEIAEKATPKYLEVDQGAELTGER